MAAVHALAYPIGGTFHVPHGLSNALVLPHVLRYNAPDAAHLYAEIAADAFPHLAKEEGTQGRCAAFIEELAALSRKLGMQTRLREVGIGEEHLAKMAADSMKQQLGIEDRGTKSIDLVIDASGAEVSIQTAFHVVKSGGTFVQARIFILIKFSYIYPK